MTTITDHSFQRLSFPSGMGLECLIPSFLLFPDHEMHAGPDLLVVDQQVSLRGKHGFPLAQGPPAAAGAHGQHLDCKEAYIDNIPSIRYAEEVTWSSLTKKNLEGLEEV